MAMLKLELSERIRVLGGARCEFTHGNWHEGNRIASWPLCRPVYHYSYRLEVA
jgi:hypothetical protein